MGCRRDDSALALQWPIVPSRVSARDAGLPSLGGLRTSVVAGMHGPWRPASAGRGGCRPVASG
ncbi:MAG: hypothetical protein ABJC89_13950, partial [Acidobacteriota bacterium]